MQTPIRYIIAAIVTVSVIAGLCYNIISKSLQFNYGHYFEFRNELGLMIDSLRVSIGNESTLFSTYETDEGTCLGGNAIVPDTGCPCVVEIEIYSSDSIIKLSCQPFDCYNCDVTHIYTLLIDTAFYSASP